MFLLTFVRSGGKYFRYGALIDSSSLYWICSCFEFGQEIKTTQTRMEKNPALKNTL